jgi:hypothetical protein
MSPSSHFKMYIHLQRFLSQISTALYPLRIAYITVFEGIIYICIEMTAVVSWCQACREELAKCTRVTGN